MSTAQISGLSSLLLKWVSQSSSALHEDDLNFHHYWICNFQYLFFSSCGQTQGDQREIILGPFHLRCSVYFHSVLSMPLKSHTSKANNPVPSICFCIFKKTNPPCNFFLSPFWYFHCTLTVKNSYMTRPTIMRQRHNYVTWFLLPWIILCSNPHFIYWLASAEYL